MKYESFFLHWCECINEAVSPDDRCQRKERSRLLWLKKGSLKLLRTRAGVPAFSSLCNRLRGVVYSDIKSLNNINLEKQRVRVPARAYYFLFRSIIRV